MKSFKQYIREEGPANGTGVFTYGLGFQADMVPTDFDVEKYDGFERTKLPWEVENALYANRRRGMVAKWLQAAGAGSEQAVAKTSLPLAPAWQSVKR
jgi:hypothetical protein